jgi:nucleoside-diphosphate-sugar epimerase
LAVIAGKGNGVSKMKVLVTGSAGLIGSRLTAVLRARGDAIVAFDLRACDNGGGARDIRNAEQLLQAASACDGIIHLAAVSRVVDAESDPGLCHEVNVGGTRNVSRAASELPSRPFVIFASSREVYGNPDALPVTEGHPIRPCNVYGHSKAEAERLIAGLGDAGPNAAILRLPNVYGSTRDHPGRVVPAFARQAALGGHIVVNGPDRRFDFTHVDDVVNAIVRTMDMLSGGARLPPIQLASGIGTSLGELAQLAATASLRPLDVRVSQARSFDVDGFVGDPALARTLLGWTCATGLESGFRRLVMEFAASDAGKAHATAPGERH